MCHILALRLWCTLGYTYFVNMQFCTVSVVFASKKYEDNDLILLTFNVQPIGRFQGQATDVDIARKEIRNVKIEMIKLLSRHIGKSVEEIAQDIKRPKYFSPSEAVDYGIIDKVLYNEKSQEDGGVVSELKRSNLI
jgi:hypothetical protein